MSPRPTRLREAHCHFFQTGRALGMLDLGACPTRGAVLDRIADHARAHRAGPILCHSARPEAWPEPAWPALGDLDRVVGERVCVAWCFDYHALFAGSAAMSGAGFDDASPDPPNGALGRDAGGGLNGVCYEAAALRVWESVPEPIGAKRTAMVRGALDHLSAWFDEVHDLKAQPWLAGELAAIERDGALPCDVVLWPLVEDLPAIAEGRSAWTTDRVRLGGGKVFTDGTLNSRTAHMLHPYADGMPEHPRGMAMMTTDQIEQAVRTCDALGVPMAAHAIGDGAVRSVLDAIERARPATPGFRIEHAELIDGVDVRRFVDLGVVASVQPCHLLVDIEALRRAVPDRLDRVLPLRELLDAGCDPGRLDGPGLVFGSDAPIVRADPEDSVLAAARRARADMGTGEAINADQALDADTAWACFAL
ncbi:MAG: amidohydrolase family protein [Planctomycetota bacterium]